MKSKLEIKWLDVSWLTLRIKLLKVNFKLSMVDNDEHNLKCFQFYCIIWNFICTIVRETDKNTRTHTHRKKSESQIKEMKLFCSTFEREKWRKKAHTHTFHIDFPIVSSIHMHIHFCPSNGNYYRYRMEKQLLNSMLEMFME